MAINLKYDDLIYPYFLIEGTDKKEAIEFFPDIFRFSIDRLIEDVEEARSLGINKVLLFGVPGRKDPSGRSAYERGNIVARAVKAVRSRFREVIVMTDVCLCAYTDHGHCGILKSRQSIVDSPQKRNHGPWTMDRGLIDNAATLKALAKIALSHAEAGADWVAPSAMAKGQVLEIRSMLDKNGYRATKIMGYSAKFASNFYGPFRNAADSAPQFGDRSGYQLDYHNGRSALGEIDDDIREGADMVMVKPALGYLDVIKEASVNFSRPIAAYNVSGEYAMVKYGARQGLWDERRMVGEIIASIKRAGADQIISYHAKDIARWKRE